MAIKRIKTGFIGECMVERREGEPRPDAAAAPPRYFSGDTLNAAVFFREASSAERFSVDYLSAIGRDADSDDMLTFWQSRGLGCNHVVRVADKRPGTYSIRVDARGERHFTYDRADSAARYMLQAEGSQRLLDALVHFNVLYLSGVTLAILEGHGLESLLKALKSFKALGGDLYFDDNYRPRLWPDRMTAQHWYREVLPLCDIVFLSQDDQEALFGTVTPESIFRHMGQYVVPEIVLRNGARPCHVNYKGRSREVPAELVSRVVDTTAAGDAFSAAYLATRLAGDSPEQAARAGHKKAAQVIQYRGVFKDQP